jgi:uncharacterized protein (TIGR03437 family)
MESGLLRMNAEMWRISMNRHKIWMFGAMLCLVGMGFSDTANGQITTSPAGGMNFQVQSGGAVSTQQLSITTSNDPTTIFVTVPANQAWLTVNGKPAGTQTPYNTTASGNTPLMLPVTVNTTGFLTGQTVSASINISISGQSVQANYQVTLTVGTPSVLSANPANLTFSAVQGSSVGSPSSTQVTISSSGAQLVYNVSASTTSGGNWILLQNSSGTTGGSGFPVQVNPSGLAAGTYSGTVFVQSTSTGDNVSISVSLTVTLSATLNVTGTLSKFVYQYGSGQGGFSAQQQTLMVSTTSGSLNYSVTPTSTTGPTTWLVVNPTGGTATSTPQPVYLSLSYQYVAALTPGTYTINLAIAPTGPSGGANTTNVTATLIVSSNPLLQVSTSSLSFTVPFGTSSTQAQTVQVTSTSGASIPYVVQAQPTVSWLVINPTSGSTSQNPIFSVYVNPTGLAISTTPYTATILVSPNNSDAGLYNIPITVSATVTGATSTIYAGPGALLFSYQTTQAAPPLQLVQLTSTSVLGFTVSTTTMAASNCPTTNWLGATQSQGVTPATLSVSVATTGMTAGFCTGNVIVTYNNGTNANSTVIIPVTVDIAATPLLTVAPPFGFGVVTATAGSSTLIASQISINSTDGSPLRFTATASTPNAPVTWLFLGSSSGTTQQYLQVQIAPSGLAVGTYTGSITISPQDGANLPSGALTIPVVLTVSANTTVTVSPTSLSFTQAQNAATPPAAQTVTLTATGGSTTFTASVLPVTGGTWLQVTPLSGTATGTLSASVLQNSLSPGTYTSNIVLTFQNAATPTATIPVSLVVSNAQAVTVTPTSLSFSYQLGGAAPPTQAIKVTSTGGAVNVTVSSASTGNWLSVTPTTGTTGGDGSPLTLTASIVPTSFTAAGTYTGTITITPNNSPAVTVNVTVTVTGVPVPQPSTISNSASGAFGSIAPGELITIKGTNIGPATGVSFSVGPGGTVSSTLAGVQVLFDTIPGTPTYVSASQINVIVPYEIAGRSTTTVTVVYQNQTSAGISQVLASQAPGIYTFSATGAGQASVLNQNGTLNGPPSGLVIGGQTVSTTPAAVGTVIAVYMTGGGQTSPASSTGTVTPVAQLYKLPVTVTATINGVNAPVQFAGAAPGLVTGVIQVNVTVPAGVSGSGLPLAVTINGSQTPSGPTVAVQ